MFVGWNSDQINKKTIMDNYEYLILLVDEIINDG